MLRGEGSGITADPCIDVLEVARKLHIIKEFVLFGYKEPISEISNSPFVVWGIHAPVVANEFLHQTVAEPAKSKAFG